MVETSIEMRLKKRKTSSETIKPLESRRLNFDHNVDVFEQYFSENTPFTMIQNKLDSEYFEYFKPVNSTELNMLARYVHKYDGELLYSDKLFLQYVLQVSINSGENNFKLQNIEPNTFSGITGQNYTKIEIYNGEKNFDSSSDLDLHFHNAVSPPRNLNFSNVYFYDGVNYLPGQRSQHTTFTIHKKILHPHTDIKSIRNCMYFVDNNETYEAVEKVLRNIGKGKNYVALQEGDDIVREVML